MSSDMMKFFKGDVGICCRDLDDVEKLKSVVTSTGGQLEITNWDNARRAVAEYNVEKQRVEFAPRAYFITHGMAVLPASLI